VFKATKNTSYCTATLSLQLHKNGKIWMSFYYIFICIDAQGMFVFVFVLVIFFLALIQFGEFFLFLFSCKIIFFGSHARNASHFLFSFTKVILFTLS